MSKSLINQSPPTRLKTVLISNITVHLPLYNMFSQFNINIILQK